MRTWVIAAVLVLSGAGGKAAPENPCTNGSFERLGADGFAEDWERVGQTVEVCRDARTGRHALRMVRAAGTKASETGLNRAWKARNGRRGAMLDRRKGGIDFCYKAVAADGAVLCVQAIPMTADPIEGTGSQRATFTVPERHVGDGTWHHARLRYHFTDNPRVRWVHFAARIVGKAGELLLDDVSYVERVGTILRVDAVGLEEDVAAPGRRGRLRARVANAGDVPAKDVRLRLALPKGLTAKPAEARLGTIPVDDSARTAFTIEGERVAAGSVTVTAVTEQAQADASLALKPKLELVSFGAASPVFLGDGPVRLECVLRNAGNAIVRGPAARFRLTDRAAVLNAGGKELPPGRCVTLATSFRPKGGAAHLEASVRAGAANTDAAYTAKTRVLLLPDASVPAPSGRLGATSAADAAVLENEHVRLVCRKSGAGFGPGEMQARTPAGWRTVAWLPQLSRLVYRIGGDGPRHELTFVSRAAPKADSGRTARLTFTCRAASPTEPPGVWHLTARFELAPGDRTIAADYRLTCDRAAGLLAFDGPMLYALDRDEAVFPGLEWLVGEEVSSGTLDIAADHPHRERHVVHPNRVTVPAIGVHSPGGTVGLLWDVHQKWDGRRDRPPVAFASPDRWGNQRAHQMGLFLPSVPEFVEPNAREAARPYPLNAGRELRLRCRLYADGQARDAIGAIDEYLRLYGLPKPAPLPHGSWDAEIAFSMRGYLHSLWDAQTKQWWSSKGGHPLMSRLVRPRSYVADLLLGHLVARDDDLRRRCLARAKEVLDLIGGEARYDAQRLAGRVDLHLANPASAAGVLASMGDDGTWRFDADRKDRGVFRGQDYHELGRHDAVEVGTCAQNAFVVLRYARIAGDRAAFERMRKTLERMEQFRVPRAAQVWEVPVHTPDLLAAAAAVDAYVEAWRFSGEKRWLRDAVTWARRGLPFVYLWNDPNQPFLLGGSIPVLGATWYTGSWFGRPVQWNGLRYANALLKLAEYDDSRPWRRIAELLLRSAVHQQDLEGENVALWPDNISAIDGGKCPWVFAPRQVLRNILKLTGRDEDAATVIVGEGRRRLHVSAAAAIRDVLWKDGRLAFRVRYPKGMEGVVLVANVDRPAGVFLHGKPVAERPDVEQGSRPGWRHDPAYAYLSIRVNRGGESTVRVEGARFGEVERLPQLATRIDFGFDKSAGGWVAAHHVAALAVRDGRLRGTITGGDPYVVRAHLRVDANACPVIVIRLRVTAGQVGRFYWTTVASPHFAEDKAVPFTIRPDGAFHEIRLPVGKHPLWSGQTVTAIRIDPSSNAPAGEFALDHVRAAVR